MSIRCEGEEPEILEIPRPGGTIRFGVGEPEGPQSSTWNVTNPKGTGEIYFGFRYIMGDVKISLHQSGNWHHAYTERGVARHLPEGSDRFIDRWTRPEPFGAGWTKALRVWVPSEDVVGPSRVQGDPARLESIVWVPQPKPKSAVVFDVVVASVEGIEVALESHRPLGGFFVQRKDGVPEVCLVLVTAQSLTDDNQRWLAESRKILRDNARNRGADPSGSSTLRGWVGNNDEAGTRRIWDLTLTEV